MSKFKVVVTDWEYDDLRYEEAVFHLYPEIELVAAQCRTEEEVIEACRDADALVNQYAPISKQVIEKLEKCKVITRYGVGVNTIDLDAATAKGICVANVPDYCMDEVADHALALLLSAKRKVVAANQNVKKGLWDFKVTQPIHRLRGQVLGLVGFGKIPQSLAEKAKPLGFKVVAFDPYFSKEDALKKGVELVSLEELCRISDVISVHAPLMDGTRGMINASLFSVMKDTALLINTSRGPVVDEQALIDALESGKIGGAALDVIEEEPISAGHPFLSMENVILTPHVAWYSEEAAKEMRTKAALGAVDVLMCKEYPKYLVNVQVKEQSHLKSSQPESRYVMS
ncbi:MULTISPECIES: C-terminal binding protein [Fictibacillus]|uniref:C-terminal binding protein n=1 Tax=Fictibacillus terranigra TaxID=3058424 RepID=A0ABT8E1V2_9BACL|nr:C-terminal binding protein [Fictibacillus sp. CENA-BCM004]MDN4071889.1 C-terminal binding protein [Fictibacillus sp. CENA-BCM004]